MKSPHKKLLVGVLLVFSMLLPFGQVPDAAITVERFLVITVPAVSGLNPVNVPPITTFRWGTWSGHADPAEYRRILVSTTGFGGSFSATEDYIRNNRGAPEWSSWMEYSPPDVGTYWTTPPMSAGYYVFAVQGRDASGEAEQEFDFVNMRRIRVIGTVPIELIRWGHLKARYKP